MLANEMPKRIYLLGYNDAMVTPLEGDTVYVREDAFIEKVYKWLKNYAFVDDNKNVNLPTLLHDFLKDSRSF